MNRLRKELSNRSEILGSIDELNEILNNSSAICEELGALSGLAKEIGMKSANLRILVTDGHVIAEEASLLSDRSRSREYAAMSRNRPLSVSQVNLLKFVVFYFSVRIDFMHRMIDRNAE